MKKLLLTFGFALMLIFGFAQTQTWDAGGDGTSWDDPMNWDNDIVPAAGDRVTFGSNANVTFNGGLGVPSPPPAPRRVFVRNGDIVTLDLDLNIGDGVFNLDGIKVQANGVLNLGVVGQNRTFNIVVPTNRNGILHDGNGNPATINIAESSTVNITGGLDGISFSGTGDNVIVNEGTLSISGVDDDGIDLMKGTFTNKGILTISALTNTTNINHSIVTATGATFINEGNITASGGNDRRVILNEGTFTNEACAIVDLLDTRARNENGGIFTNNGLFKSGWPSAGLFMSGGGTATNNAFFSYPNVAGSSFAAGAGRIEVNNGIKVEDIVALDAGTSCSVADIGIAAIHDWYTEPANTNLVGSSTNAGALAFGNAVFTAAGTQTIYTCYGNDISFTVNNVDGACVIAAPPAAVPTLSQWGLITLALLMMIVATLQLSSVSNPVFSTLNEEQVKSNINFSNLPFEKTIFSQLFAVVFIGMTMIFAGAIWGFGYEMTGSDPYGSLVASGLIAYWWMLIKLEKQE